ncbi:conserved Plasmodium protein, unknown function [Plasmodium chabaudi chabaudi]|uniref:Uncharacterized protein n=4 Tax=Plasmodium (Vinckeia) TaxID=418101 RepID=A0A077TQ43_PLACU|nr:conserved protein, unknown function [Plasmodium chabaudi chabaudi]CAD2090371.1 conserved Plasmodium protein, unknown function [Plasmodium vinckei brucechwatti]CAD2090382.1 conserved Plasmodium protein, unknown function [Plasmodium vinckei lentum]SCM20401.1 conserved Plasmodium protein, unknown function [Plasmodium chabaudi adami]SCM21486.1 conserved Plasmodium protein, unknown function [Plasmodium chabaudi chabaudi]SCN59826.1 conserved Plasmodium protein, unknown function [Plasmodium chabau|eukprot:XP_732077.2 conserved Plasmodium protein, unknown function [Plasmodium chabaudi chabaudi]
MSIDIEEFGGENVEDFKVKSEIRSIENELKNWFIKRRLNMELNYSLKKLFDNYNFVGLSINRNIDMKDKMMWYDMVNGKPELEDTLSIDAKEYKCDQYIDMWNSSTTVDNPCRLVGSIYFRCLKNNYTLNQADREHKCIHSFMNFNNCRKALKLQQANNIKNSMIKQNTEDNIAKALFERRSKLLEMVKGN